METVMNSHPSSPRLFLIRWLAWLALVLGTTAALAQSDPPARVATLSYIVGSVAFAHAGESDWADAPLNRPITRGDRLWTDPGGRVEVHLGSAVLHMDSQTFLEFAALDDDVLQLRLNEGVVNARVRQLEGGENFEIDTPQLAFRATQPGDYRIDVDPAHGITRVTVRAGAAFVYGASGNALQLYPGQQMAFAGRDLAPVAWQAPGAYDGFDQWAADRNRSEDQSISARYVPRDVVGYPLLDAYGAWAHDPGYGAVWYPRITVVDWAPYRYGHWEWIAPWGWTWIDDAPWGFAPFHYGRWAQIGSRWAWVPGSIGPRPVYAPALVVFVAGANWSLSIGSGPGIAWFPLAPGEAWRPTYRASPVYVRNVNRNIIVNNAGSGTYFHQRRPDAITAVRTDDFNRGRPVHQRWSRVSPADLAGVRIQAQPALPEPRRGADAGRAGQLRAQPPRIQPSAPPVIARPQPMLQPPQPQVQPPGRGEARAPQERQQLQQEAQRQREALRAQEEQRRHDAQQAQQAQQAQRAQQIQQRQQERERREQVQQQQMQRQREDHERQQQAQREQAVRQQQAAQERLQRQQEVQQQRAEQQQQQRASPPQQQRRVPPPPQAAVPAPAPQAMPQQRGEGRERAQERTPRGQQQREERAAERAAQDEDEQGRGRGRGQRPFN